MTYFRSLATSRQSARLGWIRRAKEEKNSFLIKENFFGVKDFHSLNEHTRRQVVEAFRGDECDRRLDVSTQNTCRVQPLPFARRR